MNPIDSPDLPLNYITNNSSKPHTKTQFLDDLDKQFDLRDNRITEAVNETSEAESSKNNEKKEVR